MMTRNLHRFLRLTVLATILATTTTLQAIPFTCTTSITAVDMDTNGTVYITTTYGNHAVCSGTLAFGYGSTGNATCSAWFAAFLTAKTTGSLVDLFYDTANSMNSGLTAGACTAANFGYWTYHPSYNFIVH